MFGSMTTLSLEHLLLKSLWDSSDSNTRERRQHGKSRFWRGDDRGIILEFLESKGADYLPSLAISLKTC